MSEAIPTVSGGKVWNFSNQSKGKVPFKTVIREIPLLLILSILLSILLTGIMVQFNFTIVNFSGLINSETPTTKPTTGYIINDNVAIEMFAPKHIAATLVSGFIGSLIMYVLVKYSMTFLHKMILITMLLTFFATTSSGIAASAGLVPENEITMQTWMEERYGFTPKKPVSSYSINEEDLIREKTSNQVAEVRRINDEFLLYDLDGKELPIKSASVPVP